MYNRGGKVWVGEKGQGLVFLENDWDNSDTQDLVEKAGLLGTDFDSSAKKGKAWWLCAKFVLCGLTCQLHLLIPNSVFLAWEENDWLSSTDNASVLELKRLIRAGSWKSLLIQSKSDEFSFKFKSSDDQWIEPPDFILANLNPCPEYEISISVKSEPGKMS